MKKQRYYFEVKYKWIYPSGKTFEKTRRVLAMSEYGAEEYVKWLESNSKYISFISISNTFEPCGEPAYVSRSVIGDF